MKLNRTLLTLAVCLIGATAYAQVPLTDERAAEIAKEAEDTRKDLEVSRKSMARGLQNRVCFHYVELIEPTRKVLLEGGEAAVRGIINRQGSEEVIADLEMIVKFILAYPNKSSLELRREFLKNCLPDGL